MDNEVRYLYLDDIIPNRFQPRENFDEQALKELAVSIREHGVIQPIVVRQIGEKYEIIAGERRYKASTMAGLTKIPAIVKNLDDKESSKVALIENLQRRDLTAIEEARTYQKILELDALTQEELANTIGKNQSTVSNKLRLLSLTDEVQDALLHEQISERHARSLLNVPNPEIQKQLLNKIISTKMTVRELEEEIRNLNGGNGTNQEEQGGASGGTNIEGINSNSNNNNNNEISNLSQTQNSLFSNFNNNMPNSLNNESTVASDINNLQNNSVPAQDQSSKPDTSLFGGNLFNNLSQENNQQQNELNKNEGSIDVIGGSGLLAGMSSDDTIKQPTGNQVQNSIGLDNNLYQNFDVNMSNNNFKDLSQQNMPINAGNNQNEEKTISSIVNEFKNVASDVKSSGKRVEMEEFDFDDFYQLVIRIDK